MSASFSGGNANLNINHDLLYANEIKKVEHERHENPTLQQERAGPGLRPGDYARK